MELPEYSDQKLLALIRSSNEDAFELLYRRYWKPLYTSALKRISDEEDAKDVVQEIFIKIWVRRESLPVDMKAAEYLFTALRYRVINYFKADQVRIQYANEKLARDENVIYSMAEAKLSLDELESVVLQAVDTMPERMQEVFILSYRKGLSPQEIAIQLCLSVQTVKNYLSTARTFLKSKISDYDTELYAKFLLLCIGVTIS